MTKSDKELAAEVRAAKEAKRDLQDVLRTHQDACPACASGGSCREASNRQAQITRADADMRQAARQMETHRRGKWGR